MATQINSLQYLTVEILQRIASYLSPDSALCFLLVCRQIKHACDDWIVWRAIIENSANFPIGVPQWRKLFPQEWKRYAITDSKAAKINICMNTEPIQTMNWLPHIVALHRKFYTA